MNFGHYSSFVNENETLADDTFKLLLYTYCINTIYSQTHNLFTKKKTLKYIYLYIRVFILFLKKVKTLFNSFKINNHKYFLIINYEVINREIILHMVSKCLTIKF